MRYDPFPPGFSVYTTPLSQKGRDGEESTPDPTSFLQPVHTQRWVSSSRPEGSPIFQLDGSHISGKAFSTRRCGYIYVWTPSCRVSFSCTVSSVPSGMRPRRWQHCKLCSYNNHWYEMWPSSTGSTFCPSADLFYRKDLLFKQLYNRIFILLNLQKETCRK